MTKKAEDLQDALGLAFSLAPTSTSLTSYSGAHNYADALTKTEESILLEARKHQLIIAVGGETTRYGNQVTNEIIHHAGTEFFNLLSNLSALNEAARGTPIHLMVEAFNQRLTRLSAESQYDIAKAGITQILNVVNTPFAMKDVPEEKRS